MQQRSGLRWAPLTLVVGLALLGAGPANACPGLGKGRAALLPRLAPQPGRVVNNSIVGLWQVTYTSAGSLFDMSFDTWHSDGTEFENAMDSPLVSAVCQGVWEMVGPKTASLHHVGWNYDTTGTLLLGTFTLDQTDTLSSDGNAYSGTFTFQTYDLNGNPVGAPVQGTVAAVRITPN